MAGLGPTAQPGLNPAEMLESRAHRGAHQAEEGQGGHGSSVPLAGVSCVIAISVKNSPNDPDPAQARDYTWVVNTSNSQKKQEGRVHFQRVLVGSLNAVEEVPIFGVRAVHNRILHFVLLASLVNVDGEVKHHYKAGSTRQKHETVFLREDGHVGLLYACFPKNTPRLSDAPTVDESRVPTTALQLPHRNPNGT